MGAPSHVRSFRGLVVDDNPGHRRALSSILAALGIEAVTANDGFAALDLLSKSAFDLILMDVSMPRMDGWTATRMLREQERARNLRRTPVYMVTSHDGEADRATSLAAGADGHLGKPLGLAGLVRAVEEALHLGNG